MTSMVDRSAERSTIEVISSDVALARVVIDEA
jgi:hypothetical protein